MRIGAEVVPGLTLWYRAERVIWLLVFLLTRVVSEEKSLMFIRPKKYIASSGPEPPELGYVDIRTLADSVCRYDLNDMDAAWLELTNEEFKEMGETVTSLTHIGERAV